MDGWMDGWTARTDGQANRRAGGGWVDGWVDESMREEQTHAHPDGIGDWIGFDAMQCHAMRWSGMGWGRVKLNGMGPVGGIVGSMRVNGGLG